MNASLSLLLTRRAQYYTYCKSIYLLRERVAHNMSHSLSLEVQMTEWKWHALFIGAKR